LNPRFTDSAAAKAVAMETPLYGLAVAMETPLYGLPDAMLSGKASIFAAKAWMIATFHVEFSYSAVLPTYVSFSVAPFTSKEVEGRFTMKCAKTALPRGHSSRSQVSAVLKLC
jgi:hypothetical protein